MKVIHSLKLKLTPAKLRHLIRKLVFQPLHGFCMPCGPMSLVLGKPWKNPICILGDLFNHSFHIFALLQLLGWYMPCPMNSSFLQRSASSDPTPQMPTALCALRNFEVSKAEACRSFHFSMCVFHSQFELVQSLSQRDSNESHQLQ